MADDEGKLDLTHDDFYYSSSTPKTVTELLDEIVKEQLKSKKRIETDEERYDRVMRELI